MRYTILLSLILLVACQNSEHKSTPSNVDTLTTLSDTLQVIKVGDAEAPAPKTYAHQRFKDVTVERIGQDTFLIRVEGQIFEANFSWI